MKRFLVAALLGMAIVGAGLFGHHQLRGGRGDSWNANCVPEAPGRTIAAVWTVPERQSRLERQSHRMNVVECSLFPACALRFIRLPSPWMEQDEQAAAR